MDGRWVIDGIVRAAVRRGGSRPRSAQDRGDGRDAASALAEAIALHTEKENVVVAARYRERLVELGSETELGALEGETSN